MTLTLELDPFNRCGPLTSGLPFSEVPSALEMKVERFRKTPLSAYETLDAGPGKLHVSFDAMGGCSGVEVFPDSGLSLTFGGQDLLLADATVFVDVLIRLGQHWEVDDYGIHAPMLGIASFHHDFDWDSGARGIDAVFVSLDPDFVP